MAHEFKAHVAVAGRTGGGIGGALYDYIREQCLLLNVKGLVFERAADDPELIEHKDILRQNSARLKFYARYALYPVVNNMYATPFGRVAILDIDFHHGNGTQDIFYERCDVLTVSIHGGPHFAYPHFTGFRDETGVGEGEGFNINYPLPEHTSAQRYLRTLSSALKHITGFSPTFLFVCLGLDTTKADPTGTWSHGANDCYNIGELGSMGTRDIRLRRGQFGIGVPRIDRGYGFRQKSGICGAGTLQPNKYKSPRRHCAACSRALPPRGIFRPVCGNLRCIGAQ